MIRNAITDSRPVHLHANGNARVLGWAKAFFERVQSLQNVQQLDTPCRVEVVTCSTYRRHSTAIERSCRYWGVGIVRLAPPKHTVWQNWLRFDLARRHCERSTADWLLFTDATDAIFTRHPQEAMDELELLGREAVIAAERNHWPGDCPVGPHPGTYPHGNGGGILGPRELLIDLFAEADKHRSKRCPRSDQYGLRVAADKLHILPDTEAWIFQTLAFTEPGEVEWIA